MPNKLTKNGNTRGRKPNGVDSIITPMPQARRIPDLSTLDVVIAHEAKLPGQIQHWLKYGFDNDGSLRSGCKKPSPLVEWLGENLAPIPDETAEDYERRERRVRRKLQRVWRYLEPDR